MAGYFQSNLLVTLQVDFTLSTPALESGSKHAYYATYLEPTLATHIHLSATIFGYSNGVVNFSQLVIRKIFGDR